MTKKRALPGGGGGSGLARPSRTLTCGGAARVRLERRILRRISPWTRMLLRDKEALRYMNSGYDKKLLMAEL